MDFLVIPNSEDNRSAHKEFDNHSSRIQHLINRASTRYASPEGDRKKRNRHWLPKYTPEGLKPRRSIEEISASIGVRLLDANTKKSQEQICNVNLKTAKKTNVSFSSYHTVYKVSEYEQTSAAAENFVPGPRLDRLGEARTAIGLLLSQQDGAINGKPKDPQNMQNVLGSGFVPPAPQRQSLNTVSILPPMKTEGYAFATKSSKDCISASYRRRGKPCVNTGMNDSFCPSVCDESVETKSQDWYNEWYQYEKYKDDQEMPDVSHILNESQNTYNSRHALFDASFGDRQMNTKRPGYDFAPLEGAQNNENQDGDDPFILYNENHSWISDISHTTSSQIDHQKHEPQEISNLIIDQQKDPEGPGWSYAAAKDEEEKEVVPNELNFESKYESRRLEKEQLIAQVVSRLSDNLSLVHDVELMRQMGGPTSRSEMDKVRYTATTDFLQVFETNFFESHIGGDFVGLFYYIKKPHLVGFAPYLSNI